MAFDLRTRDDATATAMSADELLGTVLSAAFTDPRVAEGPDQPALRPLVLEVEGRCWTLAFGDGRPHVHPGAVAAEGQRPAHLRLTTEQLSDLATDQLTPIGFMTGGALDLLDGGLGSVLDWWLVLRRALDDDPLPPASQVRLPDDVVRSHSLDDDPAALRASLAELGYLHLRGVFTAEEMAAISADMDTAASTYARGDGRSWWAGTTAGDRLVRMQHFEDHSPLAAQLLADPRFAALGAITGCGHEPGGFAQSRWEALFKPIGVTSGISDVPWHKDCSLGRHSYECARLTVGVSVTGAGPTTGQLRVIAGSHRALTWPSLLDVEALGLPDVALATETGDVTLHLSCTLHMAQPPTTAERRVLYTSFVLPARDRAARDAASQRLVALARETAPLTTSQARAG